MPRSPLAKLIGAFLIFFLTLPLSAFAGSQYGPQTSYSSADIQAAVAATNGYNPSIMGNAGSLGSFESSGNAGIYNGTCCTGVFQMNQSNLAAIGLTPTQYANMPLQQQAQAWTNLTNQSVNTPAVQQLQQMANNGQSFDGHTVDSGMILACIQLGTGNCQKMVNSGSCSGFADSNGTTICDMAAKIDGGKPGSPANTAGNNAAASANAGSGTQSDNLGLQKDAGAECWTCEAIINAFNLEDKLATNFANGGGGTSWTPTKLLPLFTTIFAIVFVFQLGRNVVFWYIHYSPPREILGMFIRFVIVATILQSSAITTNIIQPYLLEPAIGVGGQLGAQVGYITAQAFGSNLSPQGSTCTTKAQLTMTDSAMSAGVMSVVNLVCQVHTQASTLLQNPSKIMQCPTSSSNTALSTISAMIMKIYALAVSFMIAIGLITMALQIVEIAIRIGVYTILFPFFLYTWVYKRTSAIFKNMLKGYLFVFFKFAFIGPFLGAAVALFGIAATYATGVPTTCSTDASTDSSSFAALITSVLATIAVSAFANRLMTAASGVAATITRYGFANLGVAAAGAQAVALGAAGGMQNAGLLAGGIGALGKNAANIGNAGAGIRSLMASKGVRNAATLLGVGAIFGAGTIAYDAATGAPASPLPKNQMPDTPEEQVQRQSQ